MQHKNAGSKLSEKRKLNCQPINLHKIFRIKKKMDSLLNQAYTLDETPII